MTEQLNLTTDDIKFLKALSKEMIGQELSKRMQPAYWQIGDYEWHNVDEGFGDRDVLLAHEIHNEYSLTHLEMANELVKIYNENDIDEIVRANQLSVNEHMEFEKIMDHMVDSVKLHFCNYSDVIRALELLNIRFTKHGQERTLYTVPNTLFLTRREAVDYIQENKHQFTPYAHPFIMSGENSEQVTKLWDILHRL